MPARRCFLGVDVSTTSVKALLIDGEGQVVAQASSGVSLSTPFPLWSEQDPQAWWGAAVKSIRECLALAGGAAGEVACAGLTGQMHGLVMLDTAGDVLRPAILWNDQRCSRECEEITDTVGRSRLLEITGNVALPGFTAPKILWVRNHEPGVYRRAAHILLPKDYVRYHLTGCLATDKADGAGTLLFNLKARTWSTEILEALQIPAGWLPQTLEGPEVTGAITAAAAESTGLRAGTPVIAGGGDQAAQSVGVGAVVPGILALTLGTSGVLFASTDGPYLGREGCLHAFCHAVPETWHVMGVMLSAAGSLRWFRDTIAPGMPYDQLLSGVGEIPAGCDGLFFLPYLTGERTPHPDPLARGGFVGLTARHTRAHMTRAVLEGVAFGLRDILGLVRQASVAEISEARLSGGGSRSPLWSQILADVLDIGIRCSHIDEGAAYGAALLAGVGAEHWASVQECCRMTVSIKDPITPRHESRRLYDEAHRIYVGLYPSLKPFFNDVGRSAS